MIDNCTQPDRHEPRLVCGYPIPCPYHTCTISDGGFSMPEKPTVRAIGNVIKSAQALAHISLAVKPETDVCLHKNTSRAGGEHQYMYYVCDDCGERDV